MSLCTRFVDSVLSLLTGAFLIPYLLMMMFVGIPLFMLEVTIGQYSSSGPIMVWEASPLFKGKALFVSDQLEFVLENGP